MWFEKPQRVCPGPWGGQRRGPEGEAGDLTDAGGTAGLQPRPEPPTGHPEPAGALTPRRDRMALLSASSLDPGLMAKGVIMSAPST